MEFGFTLKPDVSFERAIALADPLTNANRKRIVDVALKSGTVVIRNPLSVKNTDTPRPPPLNQPESEDVAHETIDVNLTGVFHSVKAALPR